MVVRRFLPTAARPTRADAYARRSIDAMLPLTVALLSWDDRAADLVRKMLDPPSPELAIGMVSSLGRVAQRDRVRRTVFDSPAASKVAWRFLVGNNTR